jgi:hypothetical protein
MRPDPDAERLAEQMVMADDTMHTILSETLNAAENGEVLESGRTTCGTIASQMNPVQRFPKSVDLVECPRGVSGTWHSHVRRSELTNPEHSLPDMANVVFGTIDASVVVGSETSDVVMAAANRREMQETFRNVLGLDVRSTADVVDAIEGDEIQDYQNARDRVRREFGPLFRTVDMPFVEMRSRVTNLVTGGEISARSPAPAGSHLEPMYRSGDWAGRGTSRGGERSARRVDRVRGRFRDAGPDSPVATNLGATVAESAAGSMVTIATKRVITSVLPGQN